MLISSSVLRRPKAEAKKVYKAGIDYANAGLFTQAAELLQNAQSGCVRTMPTPTEVWVTPTLI
jgi:hypothetical protein